MPDAAAEALVLLNLSRDQLDRVGEINAIERRLRGVEALPTDHAPQALPDLSPDDGREETS